MAKPNEFVTMFSEHGDVIRPCCQDLSRKVSQAAVAENRDAILAADRDLFQNFERRGQRFDEHGLVVVDVLRHRVQQVFRNGDPLRKCAAVPVNPNHGSVPTVCGASITAGLALPAVAIDLADDALVGETTGLCHAHELVSRNSLESHVTASELKICLANPRLDDIDQDFIVLANRIGVIALITKLPRLQCDRFHGRSTGWSAFGGNANGVTGGMIRSGPSAFATGFTDGVTPRNQSIAGEDVDATMGGAAGAFAGVRSTCYPNSVSTLSFADAFDSRYADSIAIGSMNRHAGSAEANTDIKAPPRSAQKT